MAKYILLRAANRSQSRSEIFFMNLWNLLSPGTFFTMRQFVSSVLTLRVILQRYQYRWARTIFIVLVLFIILFFLHFLRRKINLSRIAVCVECLNPFLPIFRYSKDAKGYMQRTLSQHFMIFQRNGQGKRHFLYYIWVSHITDKTFFTVFSLLHPTFIATIGRIRYNSINFCITRLYAHWEKIWMH